MFCCCVLGDSLEITTGAVDAVGKVERSDETALPGVSVDAKDPSCSFGWGGIDVLGSDDSL